MIALGSFLIVSRSFDASDGPPAAVGTGTEAVAGRLPDGAHPGRPPGADRRGGKKPGSGFGVHWQTWPCSPQDVWSLPVIWQNE